MPLFDAQNVECLEAIGRNTEFCTLLDDPLVKRRRKTSRQVNFIAELARETDAEYPAGDLSVERPLAHPGKWEAVPITGEIGVERLQ